MSDNQSITGGQALARMLQAFNVGPMFGMGGFQLLPFYDAVRRLGLRHTLINDERCGVFAADAYAKISGRVGVCDATLGPGATNLVTGLVEALNAGSPMVVLVGDTLVWQIPIRLAMVSCHIWWHDKQRLGMSW